MTGGEGGDKDGASANFLGPYSFSQVQAMSAIVGLAMFLYVLGRPEETQEVKENNPYSESDENIDNDNRMMI